MTAIVLQGLAAAWGGHIGGGIVPAIAVPDSAHAKASANANRFIVLFLLSLRMQDFWLQNRIEQDADFLARRQAGRLISAR